MIEESIKAMFDDNEDFNFESEFEKTLKSHLDSVVEDEAAEEEKVATAPINHSDSGLQDID